MKVSVILPVFNGIRFLPEAVASVRAQSITPAEFVIVDDGSSDGTAQWLASQTGLTVITQQNQGAGSARNRAIEASHAPVLAFLDADDLWRPAYLERQIAGLLSDPRMEATFARVEQFHDANDCRIERDGFIPSAMVIRRDAFLRVGWFDETPGVPEFATWFLRARECGLNHRVGGDVLAERRIHAENKGRDAGTGRQYLVALKGALDRRRASGR